LTRGYGRDNPRERVLVSDGERVLADARDAGDEPFELATKLDGRAVIIADANRAAAGDWALTEFNISVFILDDGFQHLRVKRDLDILLIDASKPFGNNKLLPAGILREPKSGLERVDAFVITRANLANNVPELRNELAQLNPTCPQFVSQNAFISLKSLKDRGRESFEVSLERIRSLKSAAFCAIGNPENFFQQLENENFNLAARQSFRDHHIYLQRDVRAIEELAIKSGAEVLLTTAKDAVKLSHLKFNLPCFVIENGLTFDDEPAFLSLISNLNETA
jgi:tetraacyldisaccharide 4'-kinase